MKKYLVILFTMLLCIETYSQNLLLNPSFEANQAETQSPTSWNLYSTENKPEYSGVVSGTAYDGQYFGRQTGNGNFVSQLVSGLTNGSYTAKAWVRSSGGQTSAALYVRLFGGNEIQNSIRTVISDWTQIEIANIAVTTGQCRIGFYQYSTTGQWIEYDKVEFIANGVTPPTVDPIVIRAKGPKGTEKIQLLINDVVSQTWTVTASYANYVYTGSLPASANIKVKYSNDWESSSDVQVDYISVYGTVYQAEAQAVNTGVWQNSGCGGSYSEWLNCGGHIDFGTVNISTALSEYKIKDAATKRMSVFPNPIVKGNSFTLQFNGVVSGTLGIYSVTGGLVEKKSIEGIKEVMIDTQHLQKGIYYLHLNNSEYSLGTKVVVD